MRWREPHRFVLCTRQYPVCPAVLLHSGGIEHCAECCGPELAPIHSVEDEPPVEQTWRAV